MGCHTVLCRRGSTTTCVLCLKSWLAPRAHKACLECTLDPLADSAKRHELWPQMHVAVSLARGIGERRQTRQELEAMSSHTEAETVGVGMNGGVCRDPRGVCMVACSAHERAQLHAACVKGAPRMVVMTARTQGALHTVGVGIPRLGQGDRHDTSQGTTSGLSGALEQWLGVVRPSL